eukprot:TRINITY_DN2631_c0_g1_i6.p1 TRINITY_DN2631_c0_g1~~TRINITY_DN2631_c0_g1_i6.p1  ORF type:complete len:223 (-),score=38.11 TRINITY_DN2631_c0_g1_i6:373-996(-)
MCIRDRSTWDQKRMKLLLLSILLLVSSAQGYEVKGNEAVDDIEMFMRGLLDAWGKRGENVTALVNCINNLEKVINLAKKIINDILTKDLDFRTIMDTLANFFILLRDSYTEYLDCVNGPAIFLEMFGRVRNMTAWEMLNKALTRIQLYGEELWGDLMKGMQGVRNEAYYDIGYGFGGFVEVLLLMKDKCWISYYDACFMIASKFLLY